MRLQPDCSVSRKGHVGIDPQDVRSANRLRLLQHRLAPDMDVRRHLEDQMHRIPRPELFGEQDEPCQIHRKLRRHDVARGTADDEPHDAFTWNSVGWPCGNRAAFERLHLRCESWTLA